METLIKTLEKQLEEKGREINAYIEKHNIQIQGAKQSKSKDDEDVSSGASKSSGVLVSNSSTGN